MKLPRNLSKKKVYVAAIRDKFLFCFFQMLEIRSGGNIIDVVCSNVGCVDVYETFSLREMYPDELEINLNECCEIFLKGIHSGKNFIPVNKNFRV